MTKLNQIVATVGGEKERGTEAKTDAYHSIQNRGRFDGLVRNYHPKEDGGETLPSESQHVQLRVEDIIDDFQKAVDKVWNIVGIQDVANCSAKADVVINGKVMAKDIPVTHLLFLEKQLHDLHTFASKLPTLDPKEQWRADEGKGVYVTSVQRSNRSKKVPKAFKVAEATKEHKEQVSVYNEDVVVGEWQTVKMSSAITEAERDAMVDRCKDAISAVKRAREDANSMEVGKSNGTLGKGVLDFIFSG